MIKVIDKWVIDTDGKQYVGGKLAKRVNNTTGETEEYIQQPFYHTTFAGCIKAISARLRMEAIKNIDGDLEAATKAIQAADNRLLKAMGVYDEIEVSVQRGRAKA